MKGLYVGVAAILLVGCATQSGVVPIGKDTFMVSRQGFIVTQSVSAIKADAYREAAAYCTQQGKNFQVVNTSEQAGSYGKQLPTAEIQFMCLENGDSAHQRPKLRTRADVVIENR